MNDQPRDYAEPHLRIVSDSPWNDPRSYAPNLLEALNRNERRLRKRPSWFAEVRQDWREIASEVRGSPYSHALVALGAVVFWTGILTLPLLIGAGK